MCHIGLERAFERSERDSIAAARISLSSRWVTAQSTLLLRTKSTLACCEVGKFGVAAAEEKGWWRRGERWDRELKPLRIGSTNVSSPGPFRRSRPKFPPPRRPASVLLVRKRSVGCAFAHRQDRLMRAAAIESRSERSKVPSKPIKHIYAVGKPSPGPKRVRVETMIVPVAARRPRAS